MVVGGQRHAAAAVPDGKNPSTPCRRGWVDPSSNLDGCGEEKISCTIGVRTHHRPACSKTLHFAGPPSQVQYVWNAWKVDTSFYNISLQKVRGTWWRSQWRHCATRWKVAGSIPDGVTGIFHWQSYPGSTQPLTEISTRNISWGVKAACA